MKYAIALAALFAALSTPTDAAACGGEAKAEASMSWQNITVDALAEKTKAGETVHVFDANSDKTRAEFGVIPGATLINKKEFDPAADLPEDKNATLVFYCSSKRCQAAPKTADRALEAGYKNVWVLTDGIKGWKAAGQPTEKAANS